MDLILKFAYDDAGAPALEYAIVLSLIGIFLITVITALGNNLSGVFISMNSKLGGG